MLSEDIINHISSFTKITCHTCNKKIHCTKDYVKLNKLIFCSYKCFNHI